jgi:hypothetical protein
MNILTNTGYKDISQVSIGEELIYFDLNTGQKSTNRLLDKKIIDIYENPTYLPFEIYEINGIQLHGYDSIWSLQDGVWLVTHVQDIKTGSIICDDNDQDLPVTSYRFIGTSSTFWQLSVDGDSSYIGNGITLHNASRYWVGGGSSTDWAATGNTNWAATSGGANNQSVPVSVDSVFFDANSSSSCVVSNARTIVAFNLTSHTGTITLNSSGSITMTGAIVFSGNSTITGDGTLIINSNLSTMTTNSQILDCNLTYNTGGGNWSMTVNGSLTVNKMMRFDSGSTTNGVAFTRTNVTDRLYLKGGLTIVIGPAMNSVMEVYLQGGTVSSLTNTAVFQANTFIDGNVIFSGTFSYLNRTLKYVSGNVITTGSTLYNFQTSPSGTDTFDTNGMTWSRAIFSGNNRGISLLSDFNTDYAQLGINNSSTQLGINAIGGAYSLRTGSIHVVDLIAGSASIKFVGTGTWSAAGGASPGTVRINTSFESGCNVAFQPNNTLYFDTRTLTYNGGRVTTTGATFTATLFNQTTTYDTKGKIEFDNFHVLYNAGVNNLSELVISGTLSIGLAAVPAGYSTGINGAITTVRSINFLGGNNTILSGTSKLYLRATGNANWIPPSSTGRVRNDFVFASEGQTIISGTMRHDTGTISYEKGIFSGNGAIIKNSGNMVNNFFPIPTTIRGSWN